MIHTTIDLHDPGPGVTTAAAFLAGALVTVLVIREVVKWGQRW